MNPSRFALGCLAVYAAYQILGFLIHQVWLGPSYAALARVWRPEEELMSKTWIRFLTSAVWAVGFCYLFVRGYQDRGIAEGVRFGAAIGLFYAIPQAYDTYAIFPIPYLLALQWFLSGLLVSILLGIVAAAVYRR